VKTPHESARGVRQCMENDITDGGKLEPYSVEWYAELADRLTHALGTMLDGISGPPRPQPRTVASIHHACRVMFHPIVKELLKGRRS
jgi:hypothetical protein